MSTAASLLGVVSHSLTGGQEKGPMYLTQARGGEASLAPLSGNGGECGGAHSWSKTR